MSGPRTGADRPNAELAGRGGADTDRIVLTGMEFYAYHGVFDEEGKLGARFSVDVELYLAMSDVDSIKATVDYGRVYAQVEEAVTGTRFKLIEALAVTICERLLRAEELVERAVVRVHKPNAPLPGIVRDVFVEVSRSRS